MRASDAALRGGAAVASPGVAVGAAAVGHAGAKPAVRPRESAGGSARANGEPAVEQRAGGGGAQSPAESRRGGTEGELERLRLRFCISLHAAVRADVRQTLQEFDEDRSGTISLQNFQLASQQPPLRHWSGTMAQLQPRARALFSLPVHVALRPRPRGLAPVSDARPLFVSCVSASPVFSMLGWSEEDKEKLFATFCSSRDGGGVATVSAARARLMSAPACLVCTPQAPHPKHRRRRAFPCPFPFRLSRRPSLLPPICSCRCCSAGCPPPRPSFKLPAFNPCGMWRRMRAASHGPRRT